MKLPPETVAAVGAAMRSEKTLGEIPAWLDHPTKADCYSCVAPLWIGDVLKFGLRIDVHGRSQITADRPFLGLTAMLLGSVQGQTLHLSRIEFDPVSQLQVHRNPSNNVGAPPIVRGPHYHPYTPNVALGPEAISPSRDLPIAFPFLKGFDTFHQVLDTISSEFVIPGLWLEEPPCSIRIV